MRAGRVGNAKGSHSLAFWEKLGDLGDVLCSPRNLNRDVNLCERRHHCRSASLSDFAMDTSERVGSSMFCFLSFGL